MQWSPGGGGSRVLSGAQGSYELLDRISSGGMAEVFRARMRGTDDFERIYAIKRILPNVAQDREFVAMFVDEAKIAAQLRHSNIAQTYDFGIADGAYFIAMEYIDGVDLRTVFERSREIGVPIPRRHACWIVAEICDALSYTHSRRDDAGRSMNIVHRDVSPPNVLLSRSGGVKLIDFGVAKAARRRAHTATGILKGKIGYLSPEQVVGVAVDGRSDIFSAGVLLWELLANDRLYQGPSDLAVLEQIQECANDAPSTRNPAVPAELDRIVAKALARDPDDRYQDAGDLEEELRGYMRRSGEHCGARDQAWWTELLLSDEPVHENTAPKATTPARNRTHRSSRNGPRFGRGTPIPAMRADERARALATTVYGLRRVPLDDEGVTEEMAPARAKPVVVRPRGLNQNVIRWAGRSMTRPGRRASVSALPPTVHVRFESQPAGAKVVVTSPDGRRTIGTTPIETTLDRSTDSRVSFRKAGFATLDDALLFGGVEAVTVAVTLNRTPTADPEQSIDYASYFLIR